MNIAFGGVVAATLSTVGLFSIVTLGPAIDITARKETKGLESMPAPATRRTIAQEEAGKARLLFGASYMPVVAPVAPTNIEPPAAPVVDKAAALPRLIGVLVGDSRRLAVIRHGETAEISRVPLGGAIGKWQLVRVDLRSIVLREGLHEIELKLDPTPGNR